MIIELHILQNFSPSNLNRDDTNNPKDCEFGGVRRARISSQCIKRATRLAPVFAQTTGVEVGERTKWLMRLLKDKLVEGGKKAEEAEKILSELVNAYYSKPDGKEKTKTAVLLYVSKSEVAALAKTVMDNWDDLSGDESKATIEKLAKEWRKINQGITSAPDIALFGRMLAEHPELNLEAASQVAHAISTHRVTMEMDYYTAVDDLQPDDTSGAGMIGFTSFNSACFYRYACIDWEQLKSNLNGEADLARKTVEAFLRSSIEAVPTGKQTSFAANNPPGFLLAVVRRSGAAWSLANSFEQPVYPAREGGYLRPSIKAMDTYWGQLTQVYGCEGIQKLAALSLDAEAPLDNLKPYLTSDQKTWLGVVLEALPKE